MKEFKAGENVAFEVVEAPNANNLCDGCYFSSEYGCRKDLRIFGACSSGRRSDGKNIVFKEVKKQRRDMKKDKRSLKITYRFGGFILDGYAVATYSNEELKILKNLLTETLCEINEYIKD